MNLKFTSILLFLLGITFTVYSQTQGTRPNIIVILADDLGYGDVGFNRDPNYPADRGVIPTPQLDALATNGIICSSAHVAHPFCGPSRAAIMTGIYPHRIGAQYNLPNDITTTLGIPENEIYWSKVVDQTGYHSMALGKWHLGFTEGKYQPMDRGFDEFFGFLGGGKNYFRSEYDNVWYKNPEDHADYNAPKDNPNTNEYLDPLQRNRDYVDRKEFGSDEYLTDILTDQAIDFIDRKGGDADNPLLMYLAYNAPHTPLQAPQNEIDQFLIDNPAFEQNIRIDGGYIRTSDPVSKSNNVDKEAQSYVEDDGRVWNDLTEEEKNAERILAEERLFEKMVDARIVYATMVANLDKNIGRLTQKLKDMNIMDNTLIVFFSDNGGYTFSKGAVNYPLNSLKGSVDEGGHRVPFFIHWPNQIETPSTYPYQISALDLYPTFVNLAGGTIPITKTIDGLDFMDKMLAGEEVRPNQTIHVLRPQNGFHNAAIISYPYRITRKGGNGQWKLFDVNVNPEKQLSGSIDGKPVQDIIDELVGQGADWIREFKDVKPAWFDHDRGDGHPHRILWFGEDMVGNTADVVFPGYSSTYNDATLDEATAINQIFDNICTVYPNPIKNSFNITFDTSIDNLEIEILNQTGQIIKRIKSSNVHRSTVDANDLASGMYVLRIKADDNLSVEKVIKL
ncbi:sulfatase-like hydrolase/transferase [Saccharicrinis aurantiacus]|uniref:sulfatase-like hydrolase/transferase n=1 Tax=Saccharicrinis aurantiacus TaxID=1849719 RepID=UPI0008382471|nr:sulfatase-like hydrolase/transferase [Saccharicrinis aurantiacus]